jgi:serine phosphatase RsbU (regulator of sigma subunit)
MSLRLRLIVAFFLMSVVPLGAVTFYTYASNASAMREAAGREAESLAGELTERMTLVTAQLGQRIEQLMDLPEPAPAAAPAAPDQSIIATLPDTQAIVAAATHAAAEQTAAALAKSHAETKKAEATTRMAEQLGEAAMLLNNVEVRDFGRGRGRFGGGPPPPEDGSRQGSDEGRGSGGRHHGPGAPPSPPEAPAPPSDPDRIHIDLGPMRREMLHDIFPDRDRWDQLSPEERDQILSKVNERMLGIRQGIEILQQKASQQAEEAKDLAATQKKTAKPKAAPKLKPTPKPNASPMQRKTAVSGNHMDVRLMQNGQVVGEVNAEMNLPNLLATVFTTTRREKGEVPFAVDKSGSIYAPAEADRQVITGLNTAASRADTPPGTTVLPNWVIVTAADPTGTGLKFGIARPVGDALDDLRRSSARNAGLGVGLIGLALIGIVPLSSRLTRNLSVLSDGVNRIAAGDYRARVDVKSTDEVGKLAAAFNRMAADVERHERAAIEQERLTRELELGRQIQHEMLPQTPLQVGCIDVRGESVPAKEVGGDFYNYFTTSSGQVALLVGDVSGKGVGAALLMANLQASLRTRLTLDQDLVSLARQLDCDVGASTPGAVYSTLFVGLLDPATRTMTYVNAGHNPQLVVRRGGALEHMSSTGMPIGLLAGHGYADRSVRLEAGDVVFFYTDGCVEAENPAGDLFSLERLEAFLTGLQTGSGNDILSGVGQALTEFRAGREPLDDATMMVVSVG